MGSSEVVANLIHFFDERSNASSRAGARKQYLEDEKALSISDGLISASQVHLISGLILM
jgi:hypothetical protein